jgi:hypothetical protein
LTKPALGDAENYEGREKRTHIVRGMAELKKCGIRIPMSGKGNCYAMVESRLEAAILDPSWILGSRRPSAGGLKIV